MAYKCREEIVGKRFLSISSSCKINATKIAESEWRAGVIRAASHSDQKNAELNVLVEYDDCEWKRREWIKVYIDNVFHIFLVESTLVWATRQDPHSPGRKVQWPALVFSCLVDRVGFSEEKRQQIEFLSDKRIASIEKPDQIPLFQNSDLENRQLCQDYSEVNSAVKEWIEYQDGQRILLTTPSVLVGYRIEVYRSEGTTQWYTAVIISYNDNTKELTVTDDTVLEDHNEDPCLVQMKLIGDGVIESILKGENVGITPRRRSCTVQNYQNSHHHTRTRSGHHHNTSTSHFTNVSSRAASGNSAELQSQSPALKKSRQPSSRSQTSQSRKAVLVDNRQSKLSKQRRNTSKNKGVDSAKLSPKVVIEKFEEKHSLISRTVKKASRKSLYVKNKKSIKKEVIGKDENLPPHITESILTTIESVIQNYQPSLECQADVLTETKTEVVDAENKDKVLEIVKNNLDSHSESPYQETVNDKCNLDRSLSEECCEEDSSVSPSSLSSVERFANVDDSLPELITSSNSDVQVKCDGECDNIDTVIQSTVEPMLTNGMECHTSSLVEQNLKPFSDDRQSDSGISEKLSSNRSSEGSVRSSGDERSVSRSSESSRLSDNSDSAVSSQAKSFKNCPDLPDNKLSISPLVFDKSEPIKVWRDPDLLNSSSQNIRHISSVQHNSMQHPNSSSQTGSSTGGYPSLAGHHSAPPPGVASHHTTPHQHSRPGTAPLPLSTPTSSPQQLPLHSVIGHLPHHSQPTQFSNYGHSLLSANPHAALMLQQFPVLHSSTDMIHQQKFPSGTPPWGMQPSRTQTEVLLERDHGRIADWERERQKQTQSREQQVEYKDVTNMIPKEHERQKLEKSERIDRDVQQHFDESLHKYNMAHRTSTSVASWNHHHNQATKSVSSGIGISSIKHKDGMNIKAEPLSHDQMMSKGSSPAISRSNFGYLGTATHFKPEPIKKSEEKPINHIRHDGNQIRTAEKLKSEPGLSYAATRPVSHSAVSPHTKSPAPQASYSLYGYQPFQHSYMTQDSAQRALVINNPQNQGSITAGKPIDRQLEYKQNTERNSPKSLKPIQRSPMQPRPYEVNGLLRIAEPEIVNHHKSNERWSPHQTPDKNSSKLKSSHHSLVQQGLVPNPMYARPTPGSPRPAHHAIDRGGQNVSNSLGPTPSPAHMSNSKSMHHLPPTFPSHSTLSDNNFNVMPQLPGHVQPSANVSNHSVSSLPQGQPLDLQCTAAKRKSLEPENFSKKVKADEPAEALNLNIHSNNLALPTSANVVSQRSTPPQKIATPPEQVVNPAPNMKQSSAFIDTFKSFVASTNDDVPQNQSPLKQPVEASTDASPIKVETSVNVIVPSSNTTTPSNFNPTKLKKAWLQRHSGEDTNSLKTENIYVSSIDSGSNSSSNSVNSLPKKMYPKAEVKSSSGLFNGHVTDSSSSSSDAELETANSKKRSYSNSKSKKDGKKQKSSNDEQSENDKNFELKSSPTFSIMYDQPKKRGRRPKGKTGEDRKKSMKSEKSMANSKSTLNSVLQDKMCSEISTKLPKCRECRMTQNQRDKNLPNIFCRFFAFRRLKTGKNSTQSIAGFSEPNQASSDDLKLWLPRIDEPPTDLDDETSKCILSYVGDQLCDLVEQEREALSINMCEDKTVMWKRVVEGVREMCDVCETTLFNMHWVCPKCGFVVCIDCYKARKHRASKEEPNSLRDRDGYQWLLCNNKQVHDKSKLMLTQIIAGNALWELSKLVHEFRLKYDIPQHCAHCKKGKEDKHNLVNRVEMELMEEMRRSLKSKLFGDKQNGIIKKEKEDSNFNSDSHATLGLLADVALNHKRQQDNRENHEKKEKATGEVIDGESDNSNEEENFSTLRELLIRPHADTNPPRPTLKEYQNNIKPLENLNEVINCIIEQKIQRGQMDTSDVKEHKFQKRYPQCRYTREQIKVKAHFAKDSHIRYPKNPHTWWQSGKLLQLHDPANKDNLRMFQESWKRGLPVLASNVNKQMDMDLWVPKSFSRDFGDVTVDLFNCRNGTIISNQPSRVFWDGFDSFRSRLKDEDSGEPSLLKLKDWPPSDDFREILPRRFKDLMKALPLPYYTHRDGTHNLASRLPECFVKPDLGPKMYIAYGLAKYPDTGTTNLHLDISDAINVMVYVGIPDDCEPDDPVKELLNTVEVDKDSMETRIVKTRAGALWHIYESADSDKIRNFLNKYAAEKGEKLERHHDPIHDQSWYLDEKMRARLKEEYGVVGYSIVQSLGDCVFIPAGAPHQVQNLNSCIKVAEDFVSSENISHCFSLTQEFRYLSDTHTNHEDKLQIKNIIYHAIKDALAVIEHTEIVSSKNS